MNNIAILPKTIMYLLQNQNVKREVAKKVETTPSIPAPVVADASAPPVISSASATAPVSTSTEVKASDAADGTNISELLNATPA
jgi:hypothetical protein